MKANDDKLVTLTIKKWGTSYSTTDSSIPVIGERNAKLKQKWDEENAGDPSPYLRGPKVVSYKIVFSKKMAEKLPPEIKNPSFRYPTEIILKDVLYNMVDKVIFINFFTEANLK